MSDAPMVQVEVVGVRTHLADDDLVVLLLDPGSVRVVPIVVGPAEAGAIAAAQAGVVSPRPMTHDLLRSALRAAGASVDHVEVTRLHEGVFHAALQLDNGRRVDSRASDAIAVALRFGCPVLCARAVVEEAGVPVRPAEEPEGPPDDGPRDAAAEVDVAEFVDFLDHVSAADFGEEGSGPQVPPASPSGGD